jgi:hypothetical protein
LPWLTSGCVAPPSTYPHALAKNAPVFSGAPRGSGEHRRALDLDQQARDGEPGDAHDGLRRVLGAAGDLVDRRRDRSYSVGWSV